MELPTMFGCKAAKEATAACAERCPTRFDGTQGITGFSFVSRGFIGRLIFTVPIIVVLVSRGFCLSLKTNVYTPTPELQAQFNADTTTQYQATLTHNLASDTITVLSRNPPKKEASGDLTKAVESLVAVTTWSYVYGFANGMTTERGIDLDTFSGFLVACSTPSYFVYSDSASWNTATCRVILNNMMEHISKRTYADFQMPVPSTPIAPACTATLSKTSFYSGAPESNWAVDVTASCPWTAVSDSAWLVVSSDKPEILYVKATANTGPSRKGHFTVAGVGYEVFQEGGI